MAVVHWFVNTGVQSSGTSPVYALAGAQDTILVTAAGTVAAFGAASDGIDLNAAHQQASIAGTVFSLTNCGISANSDTAWIDVSGDVFGHATGISFGGGEGNYLNIGDSGWVHGGVDGVAVAGGFVTIHNAGTIGAEGTDSVGIQFTYAGGDIVNNGTIDADTAISCYSTSATILNNGIVHGALSEFGEYGLGLTSLVNNGLWDGDIDMEGHFVSVLNNGTIRGDVKFTGASGGRSFENHGRIDGDVSMVAGDLVHNGGVITGDVDAVVFSAGTGFVFDNRHGDVWGSVSGTAEKDTMTGGAADDNFNGAGGNDTLSGARGDDVLVGGAGDNFLFGGAGDDDLSGSVGKDTFTGGAGDDVMKGRAGADLFNFAGAFGGDTITDFTGGSGASHDTIHFARNDFSTFAQVQSHMVQSGADVIISLDAANTITLSGVTLASMVAADFTFG